MEGDCYWRSQTNIREISLFSISHNNLGTHGKSGTVGSRDGVIVLVYLYSSMSTF